MTRPVTHTLASGISLTIGALLLASACRTAPPPPAPQISRESLIGSWRLDSLAVFPLSDSLSDSTRQVLAVYRTTIRQANEHTRSGQIRTVTEYRADSTFVHTIVPRDTRDSTYRQEGRWAFDPKERRITCRDGKEGPCPHDRAVVERVTRSVVELRLELTGGAEGIGEFFRLRREP